MRPLVLVFLRGGADGLSLLAPVGDPTYHDSRGALALAPESALAVDETFGLHPALAELHLRFGQGSVALVPACGIPGLSRSHFDAQFRVEEGGPASGTGPGTGWLGRHLAATTSGDANPFRGVCFGQAGLPHLLAGSSEAIAASSLAGLRLGTVRSEAPAAFGDALAAMWADSPDSAPRDAALSGLDAIATAEAIDLDTAGGDTADALTAEPGTADTIAALAADIGVEVAVLNPGGWDTHDDQGNAGGRFDELATGLDAMLAELHQGAPDANVVVFSEFGRRVAPNSSGGCDHGRGGLAIVAGPDVVGGLHGDWPGLTNLDEGDVRSVNDLRILMAEVTTAVLGGDAAVVGEVPGGSLGLFG